MKLLLLITIIFCGTLGYPQSKDPTPDEQRRLILKELRTEDSLKRASIKAEILLEHEQALVEDSRQHREHIMNIYQNTWTAVTILIGLFVGIFGFLGWAGYREGMQLIGNLLKEKLEKRGDELWNEKTKDLNSIMTKKTGEVDETIIAKMASIDKELSRMLTEETLEVRKMMEEFKGELRKQIEINKLQAHLIEEQVTAMSTG